MERIFSQESQAEIKGQAAEAVYRETIITCLRAVSYTHLNQLIKRLGDDYVILTRWHPALKNNVKRGIAVVKCCDFGERIIDFTDYQDVNDLLIACDIMITDYSSIIFDYFPLGKPIIYFVYDKDDYAGDRGLYYSFDKYLFGRVSEDFESLVESVKAEDLCREKREDFYNLFLDGCDGHSTERVCRLLWKDVYKRQGVSRLVIR